MSDHLTGDDELTGALLRGAGEIALAQEIGRARHRGHAADTRSSGS